MFSPCSPDLATELRPLVNGFTAGNIRGMPARFVGSIGLLQTPQMRVVSDYGAVDHRLLSARTALEVSIVASAADFPAREVGIRGRKV